MHQVFKGFSLSFSPTAIRSAPAMPRSARAPGWAPGPAQAERWVLLGWGSENSHIRSTAGEALAGAGRTHGEHLGPATLHPPGTRGRELAALRGSPSCPRWPGAAGGPGQAALSPTLPWSSTSCRMWCGVPGSDSGMCAPKPGSASTRSRGRRDGGEAGPTSSGTMTRGYLSSERKLKRHQSLKASWWDTTLFPFRSGL